MALGRLLAIIFALLLGPAAQAQPHPELLASQPAEGAVLADPPARLTLDFVNPVTPLVARLTSASGKSVILQSPEVAGNRLIYALPPGLASGSHLVSWRVTSGEGHDVAGASLFSIGAPTGTTPPERSGAGILRSLMLVALVLGLPWLATRSVKAAALIGFCTALALAWRMPPLLALHVIAVTAWISTCARPEGGRKLHWWLLAIVVSTGAALALSQFPTLADWRSDQGVILALKLLLVAGLIGLSIRPSNGVLADLRFVFLLLVLGGSLLGRFAPVPPALPTELRHEIASGGVSAVLAISPAQTGLVGIRVADLRLDGAPVRARAMVLELSKPAYGLGPFRVASGPDCGFFDAGSFLLPLDGYWIVKLSVELDGARQDVLTDLLEIAPAS